MKTNKDWPSALVLATTISCVLLFMSCGGGNSFSNDSASDTGAVYFDVAYHGTPNELQPRAAVIDCAGEGIVIVEAAVYDPDDALLQRGGPWDCDAGQGTISSVPSGSDRTVVILGKDGDGDVVFRGEKSGIQVVADSENNAGVINCYAFATSLLAPTNGSTVNADVMGLAWNAVIGAFNYHVVVSESSNMSDPIIDEFATTENYTPAGLSSGRTYHWQVVARDAFDNTGIESQIWSFTVDAQHQNTPPVAKISLPGKGSTYIVGQEREFSGSGNDSEDGVLSDTSLVWISDMAGWIGMGETFFWNPNNAQAGTHKITLTAIDSQGAKGADTVIITVATGRLPDTGQEQGQIEGYEPVPGEDMTYTINPPTYTKLDGAGNALDDADYYWQMVRDDVTGLIWEVKTDNDDIHDKDKRYLWKEDNDFIATLNQESFGGYTDWRLPTIKELAIIVHRGQLNPAINEDYFPHTNMETSTYWHYYWSSTTVGNDPDKAWYVDFEDGIVLTDDKAINYFMRAVRGGHNNSNLVDNGDNTVTDTASGLMWQKLEIISENNDFHEMNWKEALAHCEMLELAGYDDWRLPNANELQSIIDYEKDVSEQAPAIDTKFFPDAVLSNYWSATTYAFNPGDALCVYFGSGNIHRESKTQSNYVRAVRGGQ